MRYYKILVKVIGLCSKKYNEHTFHHCLRVANYVIENVCLENKSEKEIAFMLALCHDLLEDTDVSITEISEAMELSEDFIKNVLGALTKDRNESYVDYIKRLKSNKSKYPYIIKLADMKDHLMQKDTLTDRLKEKYWEALPYLL